jgi:hypothetical protein
MMQRLGIGIDSNKLNILYTGFDHPVDGSTAGTTNAYNFNFRKCLYGWLNYFWHTSSPKISRLLWGLV